MLKGYKYDLYPTGDQKRALKRTFGAVRFMYNSVVAARKADYKDYKEYGIKFRKTSVIMNQLITLAKKTPERRFLTEVPNVCLQQAIRDAEVAYSNFFSSLSGKRKGPKMGPPAFKRRKDNQGSARFTRQTFKIEEYDGFAYIKLPKDLGRIRFEYHRKLPNPPSSVRVKQTPNGKYYVVFTVEEDAQPLQKTDQVCGVDLGLHDLAVIATNTGKTEKISAPKYLRSSERKLKRLQQTLSRRKKGSKNRGKARLLVASQHDKVANKRKDHAHALSRKLVNENQGIGLEDLNVKGMMKNKRLAKSISDAAFTSLVHCIEYKAKQADREVVRIGRFYPSSKTCSTCGNVLKELPLSVREWTCPECDTTHDRDINAAINIMVAAGLAETVNACGEVVNRQLPIAGVVGLDEAGTHRTATYSKVAA